jgi:hypothetical protein
MREKVPTTSLTWPQVYAWRLAKHNLLERVPRKQLLEVVAQMGGLHAQMMSAAELSAWARLRDATPADVRDALWVDHTLVKTWAMRSTLHLLPAASYPTYIAALRTRANYRSAPWLKYFNLTLEDIETAIEGVRTALDGRCLTREQLAEEVARVTGLSHLGERLRSGWGELLKPAAFNGHLCFGPSQGQNVTFVRPDQWLNIDEWREPDSRAAMQEMLRLYLTAYGPATRDDFAQWFGIQPRDARLVIESMVGELAQVEVDGWKAWALAGDIKRIQEMEPPGPSAINLLPNFDPYTVAIYNHRQYLSPGIKAKVYRTAGWISPVVLVEGKIEGVWEYEKRRGVGVVKVEMFSPAGAQTKRGIASEAERLGEFLGSAVELVH